MAWTNVPVEQVNERVGLSSVNLRNGNSTVDGEPIYHQAIDPLMDLSEYDNEWFERVFPEANRPEGILKSAKEGNQESIDILRNKYGLSLWISEGRRII